MSHEILLPKLGFSMTDGTIAEWMVEDGGTVLEGQPLYAIEAEKSTQEIDAPASGTLRILVEAGVEAPVGTVLGVID